MKFKEVAHLYIGCKVKYPDSDDKMIVATLSGVNSQSFETTYSRKKKGCIGDYITSNDGKQRGHNCYIENVKPILRSLSSLTEEEATEGLGYDNLIYKPFKVCNNFSSRSVFSAKEFVFLLSKGFDLFGLIESGEAIDATTQTHTDIA